MLGEAGRSAPGEAIAADVRHDLVSREKAKADYGVVWGDGLSVDIAASEALRTRMRQKRGPASKFDVGKLVAAMQLAAE